MLEKAYKHGALTKGNINKRGYNKFLSMDGEVKLIEEFLGEPARSIEDVL